ncbi:class F sortase [Pseudarthrobacter sp. AL07]|uniref:class F sortase n=1 Tax=unclassified Pseudarthrobacter TaxID=2647000 RepID=UPI00249A9A61|nr:MULTISPECIES: class F sortase [unclassified Pseudarthrobacter]MDI3192928.1 class F sortase [Pseudarthrobacter sp. AL20]MDI3207253.1 class F sortase [Pseudarthrobacter sp. AL07]
MYSGGRLFTAKSIVFVALCGVLAYLAFAFLPFLAGPGQSPKVTGVAVQPTAQAPTPSTPAPSTDTGAPVPAGPVPAGPAASPPQRLVYPAADIDVVVHPLKPTGEDQATQTIVPPPTMDGYWLSPYGVPGVGSVNTTYIAGHSWVDRGAPFNRLSTKAAAGDRLTVDTATGEVAYVVDSVTTYVKSGLKDSPIWQVAPNRLVLISCYTGDFWGTNVVVVASPEDPALRLNK